MFGWFFLVLNTSYSLLEIVSPSSNDSLLVSDLLPQLASLPVIAIRTATILAVIALIAFGALIWRRQNSDSQLEKYLPLGVCLCVGTILFAWSSSSVMSDHTASEKWRTVHENHEWDDRIDVDAITGSVKIDPKQHLSANLTINFNVNVQKIKPTYVYL